MTKIISVQVKVHPNSRKEAFKEVGENKFEIWVKEPALKQLATKRVRFLIADFFDVDIARVVLKTGATSPNKRFEIMI